ncbi:hypothetical protein CAEBREN_24979 [Caenorhabditis brenneri]|uniref:Acyltransferase 3 domain-containing protein n=1 Tax=Caenorhabditis brenneri TaxID=135651 RepID=G0NIC6_CAEBE|nr:hypothetical protein CAEBREN_24979 [Caenorhabditis brenneri]
MKNSQKPPPKEKRQDLQGIRGIAIISVLGFHFLPNLVPNGYVGVDQFFVLSGFLMCMLLQKSYEKQSQTLFDWITNFYIRRLKRILPLYFLVIFLALLLIYTVFPFTAIDSNVTSGKNALVFMSNRVGQDGDDYFSMDPKMRKVSRNTPRIQKCAKYRKIRRGSRNAQSIEKCAKNRRRANFSGTRLKPWHCSSALAHFLKNWNKSRTQKSLSVAIDVFTHTWSLSVEVQFYLLVPFLYLLGRLSGKLSDRLEIVFYLVIGNFF